MIKSNSAKYIVILLLLVACNSTRENEGLLPIEYETFETSFSQPYTHDLKHYKHGVEYWQNPTYKNATSHFPDSLFSAIEYEFVFTPKILQGLPRIALKLKFKNEKLAEEFYAQKIARETEMEFAHFKELKKSLYCYPNGFGFLSRYELDDNSEIKLFKAPLCGGQGETVLGGVASGIAIDKSANIVVCWASDLR